MHSTLVRRQLGGLVPPKIASSNSVSSGAGATLLPLVEFYSKLPKGSASSPASIRARFFEGRNQSAKPLVYTIFGLFLLGYTIDYNMHLKHHKNYAH